MRGWLITGAKGMLGRDVALRLKHEVLGRARVLPRRTRYNARLRGPRDLPGMSAYSAVNYAAQTVVGDAETQEEAAFLLNGHAVGSLHRGLSPSDVSGAHLIISQTSCRAGNLTPPAGSV